MRHTPSCERLQARKHLSVSAIRKFPFHSDPLLAIFAVLIASRFVILASKPFIKIRHLATSVVQYLSLPPPGWLLKACRPHKLESEHQYNRTGRDGHKL